MALLIDNDVTARVLEMGEVLEAIEDAYRQLGEGDAVFQPRTDIFSPEVATGEFYWWASLIGAMREPPRLALRWRSDIQARREYDDGTVGMDRYNVEPGTFMGFVLLFDTSTGELIALMNDGVLQHARVGASAGIACRYLSREDSTEVGMIGSGGMARSYLEAFHHVRDLSRVKVYSPTPSHRHEYAEEMSERLGIEVTPVESPEKAVQGTDIVATATDARTPVYDHELLEPGQFLVDCKSCEMDEETFDTVDRVFTGDRRPNSEYVIGTSAEKANRPDKTDAIQRREYRASSFPTIDELIVGESPGRLHGDETIFYRNRSAGLQFAAIGNLLYEEAVDRRLGTEIPLGWFQQNIRD